MILRQKKILIDDDEIKKLSDEIKQSFILTKILVSKENNVLYLFSH